MGSKGLLNIVYCKYLVRKKYIGGYISVVVLVVPEWWVELV